MVDKASFPPSLQVEDGTRHVFVADFGLGKFLGETRSLCTATKLAGTPGFQAPEKLRGETLTTGVDVYAFGGVLTEPFGARPLYPKMDAHAIMYQVVIEKIMPKYDDLPDPVQTIVRKCLCPAEERANMVHILRMLFDL